MGQNSSFSVAGMKTSIFLVLCLVCMVSVASAGRRRGGRRWGGRRPPHSPPPPPPPPTAAPTCNCDLDALKAEILAEVAALLTPLETRLNSTIGVVENNTNPDVFSCKRMGGWSGETIPVPYTECDVHLPSDLVDISSGKFTVQDDGVYRLTFTSRMSAMAGQTIRADMYVNGVIVGRAVNTIDTFDPLTNTTMDFTSDLETTSTLDLLYELNAGDEVYMMIDYVGTMSLIQSSSKYQIFFTGEWIRPLSDVALL